jgi:hypothetical protein
VTTSKYDMLYGRQGGRIVPFAAEAHEPTARCEGCGGPLTNAEARYHRDCEPADGAPADDGQGTLL